MDVARKSFVGLAWLFALAVAIQFLLAGLGVLGGESIEAHRQWGFVVLHLIPILMLVAAIAGRMGRSVIGLTVLLLLLVSAAPVCRPRTRPAVAAVAPRAQRLVDLVLVFTGGFPRHEGGTLEGHPLIATILPIPLDDLSPWLRVTSPVRNREGADSSFQPAPRRRT